MKSVLGFADFAHQWAHVAFKAIILIAQNYIKKALTKKYFTEFVFGFEVDLEDKQSQLQKLRKKNSLLHSCFLVSSRNAP